MGKFMQGSAALFGGIKSLWNKLTGSGLTNAQQQANEFSAQQAELNRQFQSAEADKARQWQEDYYNQYESPQAKIRQYEDAGLNPALMYGGATSSGSAPATSVPLGDSATSVNPADSVDGLLGLIMQAVTAKSVINKNNAEANAANANAENTKQATEWQPKLWESQLASAEVDRANTLAGIEQLQAQTAAIFKSMELTDAQIGEVLAKTDNIKIDTAKKALETEGVKINNELLARKILQTEAETRLANANAALAGSQKQSIDWDSFMKSIDAENMRASGGRPVTSYAGLIDKAATNLAKPLQSLWDRIFK